MNLQLAGDVSPVSDYGVDADEEVVGNLFVRHSLHEADDATLSTNDLIDVLGVSKATLNRLRQRRLIPFRYISANQVVYPYREIVKEIMMGRITFKGLSKMDALQRLQAFRETIPLHCITPNSLGNQVEYR